MTEPAFDFVAGSTAVLFQEKPVAALTPWVMHSFAAAAAAGLDFVLLTPGTTRITPALSGLLSEPGCQWLVTSADGAFYDGMTGRVHDWENNALAPRDTLADDFLTAERQQGGYLHVRAATLHPASYSTRAGTFTEQIFAAATGAGPVGWGLYEPASERWDTAAVSAFCHDQSPQTTRLVVTGAAAGGRPDPAAAAGSAGVMTLRRTKRGVLETVEFLADLTDPIGQEQVDAFIEGSHRARARSAVLGQGVGYTLLNRPARFTGIVVPRCAVFGPESLAAAGAGSALAAAGSGARLVGTAPLQSLAAEYADAPQPGRKHALEAYADLTVALGIGAD